MPKIFLIPDFDYFGGARTYFKMLIQFYKDHRFDVVVGLTKVQLDVEVTSLLARLGARYVILRERRESLRRLWYRFPYSIVFDLYCVGHIIYKERPALVVVSNITPWLFVGLGVLPVRLLYIMHTYTEEQANPSAKATVKKALLGVTLHHKVLLTVSEFAKKRILRSWVWPGKEKWVKVIYNAVDSPRHRDNKSVRSISPKVRVLTLGHVTWYKDPKTWIRVAEKVIRGAVDINVEFVWAGDGDLLELCRSEVLALGLDGHVRFLGYCDDVGALYSGSQVYFQPSLIESHGMAVVEAMYHGLPSVVSNTGGLPESVESEKTGFVVGVEDVKAMGDKIIALARNEPLRKSMGEAARRRYEANFSYERWEDRMREVHRGLLGHGCFS